MGLGHRVFFFDDRGEIKKIPVSIYEKLSRDGNFKPMREYAKKRIRYVSIFLEMKNRRPVKIISAETGYFLFDGKGEIDPQEEEASSKGVGNIMSAIFSQKTGDILSELKPDLAGLKYRDRFKWKITDKEIRRVGKIIFKL